MLTLRCLVAHTKTAERKIRKNKYENFFSRIKQQPHRVLMLNAGLLATSQFATGRSTRSRFSVVFLGPRANAELVPKFHVALHTSHAALPTA
jgi:hypothetical protein